MALNMQMITKYVPERSIMALTSTPSVGIPQGTGCYRVSSKQTGQCLHHNFTNRLMQILDDHFTQI